MLSKLLLLFFFLLSVVGCPLKSSCTMCTFLPNCKHMEFHSGLHICIPIDGQIPEEEMVLRSSIWPSECHYVVEKIIPESKNQQQQQHKNDDSNVPPPAQDDSISTFDIILGLLSLLSLVFSSVELYLRCKKLRRESDERGGYTRFHNHNNSIDSFPLQV